MQNSELNFLNIGSTKSIGRRLSIEQIGSEESLEESKVGGSHSLIAKILPPRPQSSRVTVLISKTVTGRSRRRKRIDLLLSRLDNMELKFTAGDLVRLCEYKRAFKKIADQVESKGMSIGEFLMKSLAMQARIETVPKCASCSGHGQQGLIT